MDASSTDARSLDQLWQEALANAGVDPISARLFVFPGRQSHHGYQARSWLRESTIDDPDDCEALGAQLDEANSEEGRLTRRVAIWTDRSQAATAALLRHELEHVRQLDAHGALLQALHREAVGALIEHAGGLPGSNALYNAIPMEADANAAAAIFVREVFGDAQVDALIERDDEHRALFRSRVGPQPIDTLPSRMRAFITDVPRLARAFADRETTESD